MDWRLFVTVFTTIFLAEVGDKTQLATVLYAADAHHGKLTVFAAATLALAVSTAIGVIAGATLSHLLNPRLLGRIAGAAFVVIGIWTFASA